MIIIVIIIIIIIIIAIIIIIIHHHRHSSSLLLLILKQNKAYEASNIYNLIVAISRLVNEENEILKTMDDPKITSQLMTKVENFSTHNAKSLKHFLQSLINENNRFSRLLKSTSKKMLSPSFSSIKKLLKSSGVKEIKDISWQVCINFYPNVVIVSHLSSIYCNLFNSNDQILEIECCLQIPFDLSIQQILEVKLEITQFSFVGDISEERKKMVIQSLSSLLLPELRESSKHSFSINQVINSLIEKLSTLDHNEIVVNNIIDSTDCNDQVTAVDLLNSLRETFNTSNIHLITSNFS